MAPTTSNRTDHREQFSQVLRTARASRGMTQVDAAKRLDVSQPTLSGWERGDYLPRASRLKFIAGLYSLRLDDLLRSYSEVAS